MFRRTRRGETLDLHPEDARRLGIDAGRGGAGGVAARRRAGPGAVRRRIAPRPRLHDLPLPGPGGGQRADHRRRRPALRHLGVQGHCGAGGARAGGLPGGERRGGPGAEPRRAGHGRAGRSRSGRHGAETAIGTRFGVSARSACDRTASLRTSPRPRSGRRSTALAGLGFQSDGKGHPDAMRSRTACASTCCPVLHAIQDRMGWISPGALNYACLRLEVPPAEAFGVADFYALFQTRPHPPVAVHVCDDIACLARGAEGLCAEIARALGPAGRQPRRLTWHRSPCLGLCERAPAALVRRRPARRRRAGPGGARPDSRCPGTRHDIGRAGAPGRRERRCRQTGAARFLSSPSAAAPASAARGPSFSRGSRHRLDAERVALHPNSARGSRCSPDRPVSLEPGRLGPPAVLAPRRWCRRGRRGRRVAPGGPRRRRLPDRCRSGRGRAPRRRRVTWCAMPTSPSPAPSRTGC